MSYNAQEVSAEGGQPLELYDFRLGPDAFTFTSGPDAVTYQTITYEPLEISRESISLGAEERGDVLAIILPSSHSFVRKYVSNVPGKRASLTIRRVHRTDGTNEVITLFKGMVRSVAFDHSGSTARVMVMPLTSALSRVLPRFTYQGLCNHVLFDARCKVTSASYRYSGTVSVVNGSNLTIVGLNGQADGYYNGGYVAVGTDDYRLILKHLGNVVTLLLPFSLSMLSQAVEVYAGCDHTLATCKTKFNNVVNYGGFAFVPKKNPFATGLD